MGKKKGNVFIKALIGNDIVFLKDYLGHPVFNIDVRTTMDRDGKYYIVKPILKVNGHYYYVCPLCGELHIFITKNKRGGNKYGQNTDYQDAYHLMDGQKVMVDICPRK